VVAFAILQSRVFDSVSGKNTAFLKAINGLKDLFSAFLVLLRKPGRIFKRK
jgi:hypothetical protein